MSDLQKMKDDKLNLFIEHIEKELENLEFKLQVSSIAGFSLETTNWGKYHYYLTVLLQVAKEEKKKRTKRVKYESK